MSSDSELKMRLKMQRLARKMGPNTTAAQLVRAYMQSESSLRAGANAASLFGTATAVLTGLFGVPQAVVQQLQKTEVPQALVKDQVQRQTAIQQAVYDQEWQQWQREWEERRARMEREAAAWKQYKEEQRKRNPKYDAMSLGSYFENIRKFRDDELYQSMFEPEVDTTYRSPIYTPGYFADEQDYDYELVKIMGGAKRRNSSANRRSRTKSNSRPKRSSAKRSSAKRNIKRKSKSIKKRS